MDMDAVPRSASAEDPKSGPSGDGRYLRDVWYVAAWPGEIERTPLARTLLDKPIVFWRTSAGEIAAIEDTCPHRFAPLSRGELVGDAIQCPYHGLQFDRGGACVHNPHGERIPPAAKVKAYPLVERYGFVWIWMGDPDRADPGSIPDFSVFDDPNRRKGPIGYLRLEANYELAVDNLLDLTHIQFLHKSSLGSDSVSSGSFEVKFAGDSVIAVRTVPRAEASPVAERRYAIGGRPVDLVFETRWDAPGVMRQRSGVRLSDDPTDPGWENMGCHMLTPETLTTSHYFFGGMRDPRGVEFPGDARRPDGKPEVSDKHPFVTEDGPMLAWQQARIGGPDLFARRPVILSCDAAAIHARNALKRRIRAEQGGTA